MLTDHVYLLRQLLIFVRKGIITTSQWKDIHEILAVERAVDGDQQNVMKDLRDQVEGLLPEEVNGIRNSYFDRDDRDHLLIVKLFILYCNQYCVCIVQYLAASLINCGLPTVYQRGSQVLNNTNTMVLFRLYIIVVDLRDCIGDR
jgi:hypothetical protein